MEEPSNSNSLAEDTEMLENKLEDQMRTDKEYYEELANLRQKKTKLRKTYEEIMGQNLENHPKMKSLRELEERLEEERKEVREQEVEIQRINQEHSYVQKKEEMECEIQGLQTCWEQVRKLTKFKTVDELVSYCENLLRIRDQLKQKEEQREQRREQQRKELQEAKAQHDLICVQKDLELAELHTKLEEATAETLLSMSYGNN